MNESLQPKPPAGVIRWLLHLPAYFYRARLGLLLGHRFLLLTHLGRTSGRRYQTVLEILQYDEDSEESIVMAGWGRATQWLQNVQADHAVEIQVGRTAYPPVWRIVGLDEARWTLREYLDRNRRGGPIIRRVLGGMLGWPFDGSDAALNRAIEQLPLVGFRPR
jgi:deazaflavin-dependent oxidoreductase (nitroreductase family)